VIPTIRNGIDSSHTKGHKTRANKAIGQHNTSNIAHNSNVINTLIAYLLTNSFYYTILVYDSNTLNQYTKLNNTAGRGRGNLVARASLPVLYCVAGILPRIVIASCLSLVMSKEAKFTRRSVNEGGQSHPSEPFKTSF